MKVWQKHLSEAKRQKARGLSLLKTAAGASSGESSAVLAVPAEEEVRIPGFPRNESAVELAREEQTGTRSGFSRSANP